MIKTGMGNEVKIVPGTLDLERGTVRAIRLWDGAEKEYELWMLEASRGFIEIKEQNSAKKKTSYDNGPTGHGEDVCFSDADPGL